MSPWILILAGGSGTRFWPASVPDRPKQLLPLAGDNPLIRETLDRARLLASDDRIRVLTGARLVGPFSRVLEDLPPTSIMVEPTARGTAPVLVWAAWAISRVDPAAVLISLHADHAIHPPDAFRSLLSAGARAARATGRLLTVGVPATRPETGFGYIRPAEPIDWGGEEELAKVRTFVEKPDRVTAQDYMARGYLWNSGIFIWSAASFLHEVEVVAPELGELLPLLEEGDVEGFFQHAPTVSVDEAVLERSSNVACLRATFQWDDLGAWEALARVRPGDQAGNVTVGSVHPVESKDNIVMVDEGDAVLFGVEGLVVVRSGNLLLVAERDRTPDLKTLVQKLPRRLRDPGGAPGTGNDAGPGSDAGTGNDPGGDFDDTPPANRPGGRSDGSCEN